MDIKTTILSYELMVTNLLERRRDERPLNLDEHEALLMAVDQLLNSGDEDAVTWVMNMLTEAL